MVGTHIVEQVLGINIVHVHIVEVVEHHIAPEDKLVEGIILLACQAGVALIEGEERVNGIDHDVACELSHEVADCHNLGHQEHPAAGVVELTLQERAAAMVRQHKAIVMNIAFILKILSYLP